jgi:hypothetical protein
MTKVRRVNVTREVRCSVLTRRVNKLDPHVDGTKE